MSFKPKLLAAAALLTLTGTAWADDTVANITVTDPYARSSMASSATGAAFMTLKNDTDQDDRLVAVTSDVAERVELHTHVEDANGVMKMREVEGGFEVAAGDTHALKRGGDHVMFLGLKQPLSDGDIIPLTLTFEKAGDVVIEVPVDLQRKPAGGGMSHSKSD
ncbi:copper chaperone PCu(A)C [Sedimentitalea todarodis]|uniref:Copper chaperone PCu(A)C n=1 Tax=Sedimentitalea todarodis TaxID=1631240 RepID=A0ABU3VCV5_9RHOB|nr:copper chaperone PCu(A)C [Sedimentitalea todarodis]MDU9004013.1 copper chaperone PCu(A)C [Sedimentitalea todarodis]